MSYLNTRDVNSYHDIGTTQWYVAGAVGGAAASSGTGSGAVDTLYALPIYVSRGGHVDSVSFRVATVSGAGAVARCGIYTATSPINLYPDARVVDGGEFAVDGSSGSKTASVSATLLPNRLYWMAYLQGVSFTGTNNQVGSAQMYNIFGIPSTFGANANVGLTVAQAYGALPATFPASATYLIQSDFTPYMSYRLDT